MGTPVATQPVASCTGQRSCTKAHSFKKALQTPEILTFGIPQVEAALERILADVKPPVHAAPLWDAEQQSQEAAFNTGNAAAQPAVYYTPATYQDLALLYSSLQTALVASAPPPVDLKKGELLLPPLSPAGISTSVLMELGQPVPRAHRPYTKKHR